MESGMRGMAAYKTALSPKMPEGSRAEPQTRDVTAKQNQIYKQLFDSLPQITWIAAPNTTSISLDEASISLNGWGARYTGIVAGEGYFDAWRQLIHPDDFARADEVWTDAMVSGRMASTEYRLKRA